MEKRTEIMLQECRSFARELLKTKGSLVKISDAQLKILQKMVAQVDNKPGKEE